MSIPIRNISVVIGGKPPPISADRMSPDFGWMVVWSTSTGGELLLHCRRLAPSILIANQNLLVDADLAAGLRMVGLGLPTAVLLVSDADDDALYNLFLQFPFAGVVRSDVPQSTLIKALMSILAGELWLPRKMTAQLIRRLSGRADKDRPTPREIEVLNLLDAGIKNGDIAKLLGISRDTVRWHIRSLHSKVRDTSR